METFLINLIIIMVAFCSMEVVAWITHKFVMHGLLWRWHKDHHKKESSGFFEHNDFFSSYSLCLELQDYCLE